MAMFFANMNLTRRALKPSRGYSKCSSNRLPTTCVRMLMQTTEKGVEVFMRGGTRNRSEVRTCLRHGTHAIDSQMMLKGFTKTDNDKADLLLGYEVGIHQEKEWNASGRAGGPGWGGWSPWVRNQYRVRQTVQPY